MKKWYNPQEPQATMQQQQQQQQQQQKEKEKEKERKATKSTQYQLSSSSCFGLLVILQITIMILLHIQHIQHQRQIDYSITIQRQVTVAENQISSSIDHYDLRSRRLLERNKKKKKKENNNNNDDAIKQSIQTNNKEFDFVNQTLKEHLPMFEQVDFSMIGPTTFPKPISRIVISNDNNNKNGNNNNNDYHYHYRHDLVPYLKPSFGGTHRPEQDAVFVFAAEYSLSTYMLFITTLRSTGYNGDIVIAISKLDVVDVPNNNDNNNEKNPIIEYFKSDPHVIVYVIDITCFNAENEPVASTKGGIRVCVCDNLYGEEKNVIVNDNTNDNATTEKSNNNNNHNHNIEQQKQQQHFIVTPIPDPRPARPVATTRYEIYWIWLQQYSNHSWILLIDVRDTVFQSNPFLKVPRENDLSKQDGILMLFGENPEATRIGKSPKNRKWLQRAYGTNVMKTLKDKPTICSGSTLGEVIALEEYLCAMINEGDETQIKLMGADQGFHNYLYYSQKLNNVKTIRSIIVQDQGNGIVNTLGAMRTKPLNEWGNQKLIQKTTIQMKMLQQKEEKEENNENIDNHHSTMDDEKVTDLKVLNWDGEPSPIVHQFDRHEILKEYWYGTKTNEYMQAWENRRQNEKVIS